MHGSELIRYVVMAGSEPFEITCDIAIEFRADESSRSTIDKGGCARSFNRKLQCFRQRFAQEMVNIADVLTKQAIEFCIIFRRMIITKPPEPVASLRDQDFFVGFFD